MSIELSIIIPCLNEEETLGICIQKAQKFIEENKIKGEIIIGDNGSTDNSKSIARSFNVRLVDVPMRGYGSAIYAATDAALGKYIIMADADDSYNFLELLPLLMKLREGYELVIGNRFSGKIMPGAMPWKNRHIGNPALSFIGRLFFGGKIGDFHCGLRGFSKEAFLKMRLNTTGMEFASEMVIRAQLESLKITEVPVVLYRDGRTKPPHLRPWRDGWGHLRFMLLFAPDWLFLYPSLILICLALLLSFRLLLGPLYINKIVLDVHTLLYSVSAVLLGFQGVMLAICSKVYVTQEKLVPKKKNQKKFIRRFTIEHGILLGTLLFFVGGFLALLAVWRWQLSSFGSLDPRETLRLVIPSVLTLSLGAQVLLTSFFIGVLNLGLRRKR